MRTIRSFALALVLALGAPGLLYAQAPRETQPTPRTTEPRTAERADNMSWGWLGLLGLAGLFGLQGWRRNVRHDVTSERATGTHR